MNILTINIKPHKDNLIFRLSVDKTLNMVVKKLLISNQQTHFFRQLIFFIHSSSD